MRCQPGCTVALAKFDDAMNPNARPFNFNPRASEAPLWPCPSVWSCDDTWTVGVVCVMSLRDVLPPPTSWTDALILSLPCRTASFTPERAGTYPASGSPPKGGSGFQGLPGRRPHECHSPGAGDNARYFTPPFPQGTYVSYSVRCRGGRN